MENWSLISTMFTQMSAKAGHTKHGVLAEKTILKEFIQVNDIEVMALLDRSKLISEEKCPALALN